jgi:hypothetical protein
MNKNTARRTTTQWSVSGYERHTVTAFKLSAGKVNIKIIHQWRPTQEVGLAHDDQLLGLVSVLIPVPVFGFDVPLLGEGTVFQAALGSGLLDDPRLSAWFTVSWRPMKTYPFMTFIASSEDSFVLNVTKPKPFNFPVFRSRLKFTPMTSPNRLNNFETSSEDAWNGRLPTNIFP